MWPFRRDDQIERVDEDRFAPWYLLWPQRLMGGLGVLTLLIGLLSLLVMFLLNEDWEKSVVVPGLCGAGFLLIVGGALAEFLADPWIAAYTGPKRWPRKLPRQELRRHIDAAWMPVVIVIVVPVLSTLLETMNRAAGPVFVQDAEARGVLLFLEIVVALLLRAILISVLLPKRFRAATLRRGICYHCGYNLRGRPEAPSCPECGADLSKSKSKSKSGLFV